jgi:hypothetical protein
VIVESNDVSRWFDEYLDAFAACGRGERDTASLLAYYGVPVLVTTDGGFYALTSDDQVVATVQRDQPAHRDVPGDRRAGRPAHIRAGGSHRLTWRDDHRVPPPRAPRRSCPM